MTEDNRSKLARSEARTSSPRDEGIPLRGSCDDARRQLTAYLDGELEDDRGSAVRGHLRGCEACRQIARDEAALRDGLRALPPRDPPPSLWTGVQAKLAAAEVADAEKPRWRRAVARWLAPQQLWLAGAGIAAIVALLVWKTHHTAEQVASVPPPVPTVHDEHVVIQPQPPAPAPAQAPQAADVTADLAAAPARATASLAANAAQLMKDAEDERASWSEEQKREFDAHVAELHAKIDRADEGRPRQQAYRALIRYLQGAAIRDQVAVK
ncbi:MAG: anti-sigma factor family protein [Acidobacteriota bacterium]